MSEVKGRRAAPPRPAASEPTRSPAPAPAVEPTVAAPMAAPPVPAPTAIPAIARRRSEAASREMLGFGRSALAAAAETQAAMARGFEAWALEMTGIARSGLTAAGDSTKALLGARTLADAVEVQIGFARRSMDMLIGGSVKLTEIGVRLANEVSRPMLSRIAEPAKGLHTD